MSHSAPKNVVNLGDFDQLRKGAGYGAGARVLKECRDIAARRLEQHIARMMEKVDDALFSRAEKAESNSIQTRYFDAMREMRIIRKDIEESFIEEFRKRFDAGTPRQAGSSEALSLDWESGGDSDLSLVESDDLEEDLAVTNMVNKLRGTCTQSMYALDRRIGLLIRDPELERWFNPLGPECICNAFKTATKHIETGIEIRLVVLKLFDQHVVNQIDALYKEINQHLVSRGVMPEVRATVRRNPNGPAAGGYAGGGAAPVDGACAEPGFAGGVAGSAGMPGGVAGGGVPGGYADNGAGGGWQQPIHALTYLQQGSLPAPLPGMEYSAEHIDQGGLTSGTVNILHGIKQSGLAQGFGQVGDMTIDIVALLFDHILEDPNIPDALRALIGRLQIPMLKVALLDRNFFARKSHPARQLLNRLSTTAISWSEDKGTDDPLFRRIESLVQTILDDFEDDVSLFERLLADFDDFMVREEQQAQRRAEYSARVMEGQERLQIAKSTTLEEITPRVDDSGNLDFVRRFVSSHWKNLLFVTCARHGKDSEAWKQAVATMDDLIWSVKPKRTAEDRRRLVALQPGLLARLREGMERLSLPATERDDFIARLVRAHGRTAAADAGQPDASAPVSVQTEELQRFSGKVIEETASEEDVPVEAINEPPPAADEDCPDIDDQHTATAAGLETGTWVEFLDDDDTPMRAKLSWISPITGTYLFTDRQGLKAGNLTVAALAQRFRCGKARIINGPLLDQAVVSALKQYVKRT